MDKDKVSKVEALVKKVMKYKKYKTKYIVFNTLSKIKLIGKLFKKKRDTYFSKYILLMSELDINNNNNIIDDYEFEVIPI